MKICIIPARAGSKRIEKKNIIPFFDKPIISYAIKVALDSNLFDEVMVSTEDQEIAEISKSFGAKVPFLRSIENASDFASTTDVLLEVIEMYEALGLKFDSICCLYPTSVLINSELINLGFEKFISNKADSLFTVQEYKHPIQRALRLKNQKLNWVNKEFEFSRTQDLETSYFDCGQFYMLKTSEFLIQKSLLMNNTIGFLLAQNEAQDIDNYEDLDILKLKFRSYK
ncbi:MAG: pseudaminic acid cytidylyltransferase [Leadbetterella sp.]|nr:pseudaminic acid cytidylyltransferase [Leadbetterella sp.]